MTAWNKAGAVVSAFLLVVSLHAHGVGGEMADAANHFLASLNPEQKSKATFELNDK